MWSEGAWTQDNYRVAYGISDNPFGPFERVGTVLQSDTLIGTGAGHHSVIFTPDSDRCYVVYHRHPVGSTDGNNRVVCIDEMFFDENGYIKPIVITNEGVESHPLTQIGSLGFAWFLFLWRAVFGGFSRRHSGLCREERWQKTPSQDGKQAKMFTNGLMTDWG